MYDSVEESAESKDIEDLASKAYTSYISEVMSLMVLYVDPNVNIDEHTIAIQESAELAVKMTKLIFKVIFLKYIFNQFSYIIFKFFR